MGLPNPDEFGLLEKFVAAATAVIVPVWGARTWFEKRQAKKLDKEDFKDFLDRFDKHCEHDQEVQAKLFDKVDELKTILIERLR